MLMNFTTCISVVTTLKEFYYVYFINDEEETEEDYQFPDDEVE